VTRGPQKVGTDGKLGGQAQVPTWPEWKDQSPIRFELDGATDGQVRTLAEVSTRDASWQPVQENTVIVAVKPHAEGNLNYDGWTQ